MTITLLPLLQSAVLFQTSIGTSRFLFKNYVIIAKAPSCLEKLDSSWWGSKSIYYCKCSVARKLQTWKIKILLINDSLLIEIFDY